MTRTATPTKPRLTRERIVDAALRVMDTDGLDAVSMRRVAREVGVEAMSLYNHVRDKEDLLNGVIEQVMSSVDLPEDPVDDDWIAYGREIAYGWRTLLRAHPSLLQVFAERKRAGASVEALRPMEAALLALRRAGLSESDAVLAFQTIGGYIFGSVMMESGALFGGKDGGATPMPDVAPDQLPNIAACLPFLSNCDFDAQFAFGLDLMLDGIRAKIGAQ
jgi:TetR/AcrR family tetracycline transcriptional repressor